MTAEGETSATDIVTAGTATSATDNVTAASANVRAGTATSAPRTVGTDADVVTRNLTHLANLTTGLNE